MRWLESNHVIVYLDTIVPLFINIILYSQCIELIRLYLSSIFLSNNALYQLKLLLLRHLKLTLNTFGAAKLLLKVFNSTDRAGVDGLYLFLTLLL